MNNNGEKNELSEPNLEQVAGGRGIPHPLSALYRCPLCHAEQIVSHPVSLPTMVECGCGGRMVRVDE